MFSHNIEKYSLNMTFTTSQILLKNLFLHSQYILESLKRKNDFLKPLCTINSFYKLLDKLNKKHRKIRKKK